MKKGTAKYYTEVCTSICLPQEELRAEYTDARGTPKTADEEEDEDDDDDDDDDDDGAGECAAVAPVAFGMSVLEEITVEDSKSQAEEEKEVTRRKSGKNVDGVRNTW
ncbi:hypothetical protein RUM44_003496 [Polyplax serrata]|uniref:Uncharacterized protein n=1 Tax=Polyplax serrata TaxID=468196 RepID=A0ABR1AGT1_POLSC